VDRSLALQIRYSDSDAPRGHTRRHSVARFGRDAQFARWKRKMRAKSRHGVLFTVTTVVDNPPSPLSAARVAALSSDTHARKMRFRIAKLSINRYWVNCDQSRFWFQHMSHFPHARQDHRGAPVRGIGIGGESGSSGHTTPGSEGFLRGGFNWAPSGGLNGRSTVGFSSLNLKYKTDTYRRQMNGGEGFENGAVPGKLRRCIAHHTRHGAPGWRARRDRRPWDCGKRFLLGF